VKGLENVPAKGPYILAVNHLTVFEPPVLLAVMPIKRITVFVGDTWKDRPIIGWLLQAFEGIFVNRGRIDRQALRAALDTLKNEGVLGIAPEGTRSRAGGLIRAKAGIAYIATKANVPILPVGISGQLGAIEKLKRLHRPHLQVNIGQLVHLPALSGGNRGEQLQKYADEVMTAIARLIDPDLRGVYATAVEVTNRSKIPRHH